MTHLKGQSIVETIIAAALISVAIIAALSLMNQSQKQSSYARSLAEANKYGSQAVDWLRTERELRGWASIAAKVQADGSGSPVTYCLSTLPVSPATFLTLSPGACLATNYITGTIYVRDLTIDPASVGSGILKINSNVSWQEKILRNAKIETELSKWN